MDNLNLTEIKLDMARLSVLVTRIAQTILHQPDGENETNREIYKDAVAMANDLLDKVMK